MGNKSLLFVGNINSFVVKSIMESLKSAGCECLVSTTAVTAIEKHVNEADALFLYVDDELIDSNQDVLVFIKDTCVGDDKKIFIMGYPDTIGKMLGNFPQEVIGSVFERPIDTSEVVSKIVSDLEKDSTSTKRKHILVVDDNGTFLRTMKSTLEENYRVSMVNSAINAMTFIATRKPDLILLDYEMPVCNGPQMLEMLRAEVTTETIPVIFLTGHGDRDSVQKVVKLKPQGYLLKTLAPAKILENINQFFENERIRKIEESK